LDLSHAHGLFLPDRGYRPDVDIPVANCGTRSAALIQWLSFACTNPGATIVAMASPYHLADVGFAVGSAVVLVGCVRALQSSAGASWLPETILSQCLRREKRVVVLLNREMKEPQAVEVLCHEWAHALAWNFSVGRLINAPDTDPADHDRARQMRRKALHPGHAYPCA